MKRAPLAHLPVYCVVVLTENGVEIITEAVLSKEAADAAAKRLADIDCDVRVKETTLRLVVAA